MKTTETEELGGARPAPPTTTDLRQLIAAAAHEIRNPLNTMAIHCEILESRLHRDKDRERSDLDVLLRSVSALSGEVQRVDRILDRFLVHAGPPEAEREPVEADEWLEEAVAPVREAAARRGVAVALALSRGGLGRWCVDAESLGRALYAVLDNAVLATGRGGEVRVEAESDGERAQIRVIDQGEGIPRERLANVCQLGYTTRAGHGGLGLAIARQVVKAQHGGELLIESEVGKGTRVTLNVPLDDEI
jgi:signal transduction histidine kinase